ncbi:MAG: hypothetical protein ACE5KU_00425 [Nitrososphaerales archaeon]
MNRKTSARIASLALFVLGFIEVTAVTLLFLPKELIADMSGTLPWELSFAAWLSLIFGSSRLLAGFGVWSLRKWGIVLGVILSSATVIAVPSVYRAGVFGIMDLLLAMTTLVLLLLTWFGNKAIHTSEKTNK